jgi:RNA polymerase sigma factor (sigma-70 family)
VTPKLTESGLGHLLRDLAPQVLAAVARRHGDFAAAEDVVQEALIAAAKQWPDEGVPANPRGWLYHVALRRMTDHLRSEMARRRREDAVATGLWAEWAFVPPPGAEVEVEQDDALALLFMCCHPALTPPTAIALTLRAVGGLTTAEIAGAFFVPETTMAQRISRAKQSIKSSGVPFTVPAEAERAQRLGAVLHVLYLIFNEGYASSSGPALQRIDLSTEAIQLTRKLRALLPGDGEVAGLLALMLLTDARRAARTGPHGELIPLDEQDRTRWDRALIREGITLVSGALLKGVVGPYQLQAAIAAVHDEAADVATTDWPQVVELYGVLAQVAPSPLVDLNRAVAVAMVEGPQAGLDLVDELAVDKRLTGYHLLFAARADLLRRLGRRDEALLAYRDALDLAGNEPERAFLRRRLAELR